MTISELIKVAFGEDLPGIDVTTDNLNLGLIKGEAKLLAKEDLVLSGSDIFEQSLKYQDPSCEVKWYFSDGELILKNQNVAIVKADLKLLLKAERVALNFLGHLSGVATLTRCFVQRVAHTKTQILDTRKTIPGLRTLEKRAVVHGGGTNHRMNLSDAVMIKDNHISAVKSMTKAIELIRQAGQKKIEVEARTLDEVQEAVQNKVNQILLDNMSNENLKKALLMIPPEIKTEASGNMNLDRVAAVAELGVTYISVGALTHSAPSADFSLKIDWGSR